MGKVHYFHIMWKNKYGLVIFLLALILGIICDLQMSLIFRVNIFMFVSSKTEPQKNNFTNICILSKQTQRKLTVSTVTVGQCYEFSLRI